MSAPVAALVGCIAGLWLVPCQSSVLMRPEECLNNGTYSRGCGRVVPLETLAKIEDSHRQVSVLEVESPGDPITSSRYTPVPFAAFLQPRPVFQGPEEKVFNVLDREQTVGRLLKGGKRQKDREVNKEETSVSESESTSRSGVKFRRRKGGKRTDEKRQLRRERIERRRNRRKERRKARQEKKKNNKPSNKNREGRKKNGGRRRLKSLKTRNQRRNRKEQIGKNPTVFVEEDDEVTSSSEKQPRQGDGVEDVPADEETSGLDAEGTAAAGDAEGAHQQYLDVRNSHGAANDLDTYGEEQVEDEGTDVEYEERPEDDDSDYQVANDYFDWKDNSSIDYFTQGEDSTVSPESWPPESGVQLDPSHITLRQHLIRLHNLLRSKVEPPAANMLALSWHGAAASQARQWAEACVAHRGRDEPSARWTPRYGACGQNVLVTRKPRRWAQVIRSWWSERRYFEYGQPVARNASYRARSYTQMVWYSSHKVGCGYAQCSTPGGHTFHRYVCNYCPAGNDPARLSLPYTRGRSCEMCPRACRSVCPEGRCRLCTNRCPFSDLWANCDALSQRWRQWLCNTKTLPGVERYKNCRATCQCALAGDKIL